MRTTRDTESVMAIIHFVDASIPEQSLRDCLGLGKFTDEKHRPILAKLSRSCEVSSILSNPGKLNSKPGISIKPDMTRGHVAAKGTPTADQFWYGKKQHQNPR